ncbi:alpha/beta fold hydrolase [Catellatospora bangladeshensis]|uniref:AB hydrolase-1 domain-containing protein n=1 Tax=Catellatospora bangladeshensis TaxID=310355 RepID=A0A8J3JP35_9ACTN|nr:alpha/beta hydrolase [Catellatospora bangladeshensis]GIF82263.1 hypothetical protein Cba03nite_36120 [Catellatospora bangladeshensis]
MASAPIILVPGFWLGAWAWDDVAARLRADGHDVTALTLPGLESAHADRAGVGLADHIDAICDAVQAAGEPVLLAVHSGAGVPGYAVTDRLPGLIAAMVYVDSGPATAALDAGFDGVEQPLPADDFAGLSPEQLAVFRERAVPEPGAALREAPPRAVNDARLDVPSTVICTSMTAAEIKAGVADGVPWLAGLADLRDVTYLDLPTSHWPMWTRPADLAEILSDIADRAATR